MPIRNEADFIERSLGAVLGQDYPRHRYEILIADGMSTDNTLSIIQQLDEQDQVRIIPNEGIIQAIGMNNAIRIAQGQIIIRVDGHTIIAPDYIRSCVQTLQETGAANVGGGMYPQGITPMGQAIALAGRSRFAVPSAFHVSNRPAYTDTVYMGAWQRNALEAVNGFDESLAINEDYELNYRIRQQGGRIYFSPAIRSEYYGRQTLRALARQYFRYGRYKIRVLKQHPRSVRPRQVVAPAFVAALIFGGLLAPWVRLIRWLWLLIILTYTSLNIAVSWQLARRHQGEHRTRLPLVFLTIHMAWGIGFWVGLFDSR